MRLVRFSLLVAACAVLFGCANPSDSKDKEPAPTTTSQTEETRPADADYPDISIEEFLAGQWEGQFVVDDTTQELPSEKLAALKDMRLAFELRPNGTMTEIGEASGKSFKAPGKWRVTKLEDEDVTIEVTYKDGKTKSVVMLFESDDSFLMPVKTEVANTAMRFERLK